MSGTAVIIGAGPGLGMALARRFGNAGYALGLLARNAARLRDGASVLREAGIHAAAYPADALDAEGLRTALDSVTHDLGPIDVLVWAIGPGSTTITPAAQVTPERMLDQVALHVGGAVTATQQVLPTMLARGSGTVLLATGASSVIPIAALGDVGIAMAGLRNWALSLRAAVARSGVHVATVTIATLIASGHPDGDPDAVAERFLVLHRTPGRAEEVIGDLEEVRRLVATIG